MVFDDLPAVFSEFVLPVSPECSERHEWREHKGAESRDRGLVKPFLHAHFNASATRFWCYLYRQRRRESCEIPQRVRLARLQHTRGRYLHHLHLVVFVKKIT